MPGAAADSVVPWQRAILAISLVGAFAVNVDQAAVPVASPAIGDALDASLEGLQWVNNAFLLPLTVLLVAAGAISDRFGRPRVLLLGLVLFAAGAAGCSAAGSVGLLLGMRAIEGLGAALVVPTTIAALRGAFAGPRLGFALGVWLAAALGGAATGPVIGGLLIEGFSWRAVFWPQVALGAVAFALALPVAREHDRGRPDVPVRLGGLAAVALALAAVVAGLIRAGAVGWGSVQVLAPIGAGVALLGGVTALAARAARRTGALGGTDVPGLAAGLAVLLLAFVGNVGVYFLVSIWLQRVVGLSPLAAGVQLLPTAGLAAITSPLGGRLVARLGPERPLALGLLLQTASLLGLATLDGSSAYGDALPFLVLFGLSVALIPTAAFTVVMRSVAPERSGLASGAQTCALNLGAVLSVAVLGTVVASAVAARYGAALLDAGLVAHVPSAAAIADVSQGIAEAPAGADEATLAAFEQASDDAFSSAMGLALRVGAGFVLGALAVVAGLALHRRRAGAAPAESADALRCGE